MKRILFLLIVGVIVRSGYATPLTAMGFENQHSQAVLREVSECRKRCFESKQIATRYCHRTYQKGDYRFKYCLQQIEPNYRSCVAGCK